MGEKHTAIELANMFEINEVQGRIEFGFWSDVGDWISGHCGGGDGSGGFGANCQGP